MIARRAGAHAFEFLNPDMNLFHADVVAEMGGTVNCHNRPVDLPFTLLAGMLPDGRATRNQIFSYRILQLFGPLIKGRFASSRVWHGQG
jgi:hypothetical protein